MNQFRRPLRLVIRDEVLTACRTELIDLVNSLQTGVPSDSPRMKLLSAQLNLLLGARRPAVAALEQLSADPGVFREMERFTLRSGEELETLFTVDGDAYRYFYALYNHTWRNERIVEVPIAERFLRAHPGETLEIGNVMGHYFQHNHAVVDKYENAPGITHADILEYVPDHPFDTILSISTIEHIGKDHRRDDSKTVRVYEHIVHDLLAEEGVFMFTVPVGFNPVLDGYLDDHTIRPDRSFCLQRTSGENDWVQVDWNEAKQCRYNAPFPCANALYVGIAERNKRR
jgi:hypothetical protein